MHGDNQTRLNFLTFTAWDEGRQGTGMPRSCKWGLGGNSWRFIAAHAAQTLQFVRGLQGIKTRWVYFGRPSGRNPLKRRLHRLGVHSRQWNRDFPPKL